MRDTRYVSMRDGFMSGWGPATGKINIFQVECDNAEQAEQIMRAAAERGEMTRISQHPHERKSNSTTLVTNQHFNRLGPLWQGDVEPTRSYELHED